MEGPPLTGRPFDVSGWCRECGPQRPLRFWKIALQTIRAFQELWDAKFPINRMDTAEKFASPTDFRPDGSFIETHGPDLVNDTSAYLNGNLVNAPIRMLLDGIFDEGRIKNADVEAACNNVSHHSILGVVELHFTDTLNSLQFGHQREA